MINKRGRPSVENPENLQVSFKISQEVVDALTKYAQQLKTKKGTMRQHISKGMAAKSIILDWYYERA